MSGCFSCPLRLGSYSRPSLFVLFLGLMLWVIPGILLAGGDKIQGYRFGSQLSNKFKKNFDLFLDESSPAKEQSAATQQDKDFSQSPPLPGQQLNEPTFQQGMAQQQMIQMNAPLRPEGNISHSNIAPPPPPLKKNSFALEFHADLEWLMAPRRLVPLYYPLLPAKAEQPQQIIVFQEPGDSVFIPEADYRWLKARAFTAEEGLQSLTSPLLDFVSFSEGRFKARAEDRTVHFQGTLHAFCQGREWKFIPLFGQNISLLDLRVGGKSHEIVRVHQEDPPHPPTTGVYIRGDGPVTLHLSFAAPLKKKKSTRILEFPIFEVPCLEIELSTGEKSQAGHMVAGKNLRTIGLPTDTLFRWDNGGESTLHLEWYPKLAAAVASETEAPTRDEPVLFCDQDSLLSFSENFLRGQVAVSLEIARAPVGQVQFEIPPDLQILDVTSQFYKSHTVSGSRLTVQFDQRLQGHHKLFILFERPLDLRATAFEFRPLAAVGAIRERGLLAIESAGSVEIKTGSLDLESTETLTRLDPSELTPTLRAKTPRPILHAYRFFNPKWRLPLFLTIHPTTPILPSYISQATVYSCISPESTATQIQYQLNDFNEQFLTVHLPDNSQFLSGFLGNRPIKASREAGGGYKLPLGKGGDGKGVLSLTYLESRTLTPLMGGIDIRLPAVDSPIGKLNWTMGQPQEHRFFNIRGNCSVIAEREFFLFPFLQNWGHRFLRIGLGTVERLLDWSRFLLPIFILLFSLYLSLKYRSSVLTPSFGGCINFILILFLLAVVVIAYLSSLGTSVSSSLNSVNSQISGGPRSQSEPLDHPFPKAPPPPAKPGAARKGSEKDEFRKTSREESQNNFGDSESKAEKKKSDDSRRNVSGRAMESQSGMDSGVLPIQFKIPRDGKAIEIEKLMVRKGETVSLSAHTLGRIPLLLLKILAVLFGLGLGLALFRQSTTPSFLGALLLLAGAVVFLPFGAYFPMVFRLVVFPGVGGFLLLVGFQGIRALSFHLFRRWRSV